MPISNLIRKIGKCRLGRRHKIKVAIVANCQGKPLAQILPRLNPDIEVTAVAVIHLLRSEQVGHFFPLFENADFIIAQLVNDKYPCDFVRTAELKKSFGDKIISIINLHYVGYNPELIYLRSSAGEIIKGPLGDYHNKTIFETWEEGASVDVALKRHCDFDYNKGKYSDLIDFSLHELQRRENVTGISIADFIEKNISKERLFFSFNHPCMALLTEYAKRILTRADLRMRLSGLRENSSELLDNIIAPVNIYSREKLNLEFNDLPYFKGVECISSDGKALQLGERRNYDIHTIFEMYYRIYDNMLR